MDDRLDAAPASYREWLSCLKILEKRSLTEEEWKLLSRGTCPGYRRVEDSFCEHLQQTITARLRKVTGQCTQRMKEALEEGDFSNMETLLRRSRKNLRQCRFAREISFLPEPISEDLDRQVQGVIRDYWKEWIRIFREAEEETGNEEWTDLLRMIRRMEREYGEL